MLEIAWGIILAVIWLIVIVILYLIIEDKISYSINKKREEEKYREERDRRIKEMWEWIEDFLKKKPKVKKITKENNWFSWWFWLLIAIPIVIILTIVIALIYWSLNH
jgi:uncharacterized BrkB/YihY/UPF0761 family membrane protein